jgi:benzoylformate decarboxylase
VLRNEEYSILKWFADTEEVTGAPGLQLPALNTAEVASGYGVKSRRIGAIDELRSELESAIPSSDPELIEIGVAPGMALF